MQGYSDTKKTRAKITRVCSMACCASGCINDWFSHNQKELLFLGFIDLLLCFVNGLAGNASQVRLEFAVARVVGGVGQFVF